MSIVKIVDAELKIDVNEEISAANITASIIPRKPIQLYWIRNLDYVIFDRFGYNGSKG